MVDPKRIWSSPHLPSLPSVAVRLLEVSRRPELEVRDVVEVIRTDPAISAKILKATNSSYFGLASQVTSVERAVPLLGTTMVTSLALSFSVVQNAVTGGPVADHYRNYWAQSVVQATTAELLSDRTKAGLACEYFLAGLLIDLGRLAMLKTIPNEFSAVIDAAAENGRPLHEIETERLGFDHVEIGMKLMETWSLPGAIMQSVHRHHASLDELRALENGAEAPLIRATAFAADVGEYFCGRSKGHALTRLRASASELFGMGHAELARFLEQVKARVDEGADLFCIDTELISDPADLMATANEQLAQLAMREHAAGAQARAQQEATERERALLEDKARLLERQAFRDPLTQIHNRQFFGESLSKELDRCARTASTIGLIFLDIDHFKQLNDTHGHQFGDEVLVRVAKLLGGALRKSDVLARYGGEEFVAMVVQPTEKGLGKVAERLRTRVESDLFERAGQRVPVTISVGTALAVPRRDEQGLDERLIAAADQAMYESKRNGRNQVASCSLLSDDERRLLRLVNSLKLSRWLVERRVFDVPTLTKALQATDTRWLRVGEIAQRQQMLSMEQVDHVLAEQSRSGVRFGEAGIGLGLLCETRLARLLALQQEDPATLVRTLVRLGMLDEGEAAGLIDAYSIETEIRTQRPKQQPPAHLPLRKQPVR
ncbi:MAG: HDOD domain-containing protein [Planctomycetaceae bacterium]